MTFNELSNFTKQVLRLLDDESYGELQIALFQRPDLGKVIKGSGGLRKVRWAAKGHGKSGGVRVIYYWWVAGSLITFCDIYPKNEKEDLTTHEIKKLREQLEG
ncbi:MAG: type II toxin-antitoxin system RelE/ParE family toxin [Verrucomicrobiota bacterium]